MFESCGHDGHSCRFLLTQLGSSPSETKLTEKYRRDRPVSTSLRSFYV